MKKKKQPSKEIKKKEGLGTNPNPNHKEDFEKALQMLVPKIVPKGKKSDKLLDED